MGLFDVVPYILLLLFCLICARNAQRSDKPLFVFLIIVAMTLFAGFRDDSVGVDTQAYISNLSNGNYKLFEYGFRLLSQLFFANKNYVLYLTCIALIIYTLFVLRLWELRKVLDFPFSIFLFYIMHFSGTMNTMRQYIACAIVFWGTRYLYKNKALPYILCVLLAMQFHKTAFIAIFLLMVYFFSWRSMTVLKKLSMIILLATLPAGLLYIYNTSLSDYIAVRSEFYSAGKSQQGLFIYIEIATMVFVMIMNRMELASFQRTDRYLIKFTWLFGFIGTVLSLVGYYILFMGRIAIYYSIFVIVLYSIVWKFTGVKQHQSVVSSSANDLVTRAMILLVTVIPFVLQLVNNSYEILPYILR